MTGSVRDVLIEHPHRGHMGGFTDNYLRVEIDMRPELANKVVPVRLTALSDSADSFRGEVIP